MQRTVCYRASDNDSLLLEEHTLAFRLTSACERSARELGVSAGNRVRVELLDDSGHLLDSRNYLVPPYVKQKLLAAHRGGGTTSAAP
jgi:hypothetical protein